MPTSPRRRLALSAALCLLGGAAATVLVAWGFVVWGDHSSILLRASERGWPGAAPSDFPAHPQQDDVVYQEAVGLRSTYTYANRYDRNFGGGQELWYGWRLECGWPLLALNLDTFSHYTQSGRRELVEHWPPLHRPMRIPLTRGKAEFGLPTRPIPLGFTLDTLFYAAILAALFLAPPRLRRSFRLRRGLCPACAYNLAGNTTGLCPECGTPTTPTQQKQQTSR